MLSKALLSLIERDTCWCSETDREGLSCSSVSYMSLAVCLIVCLVLALLWVENSWVSERGTVLFIMLLYYILLLNCINKYESVYFTFVLIITKALIL